MTIANSPALAGEQDGKPDSIHDFLASVSFEGRIHNRLAGMAGIDPAVGIGTVDTDRLDDASISIDIGKDLVRL